MSAKSYTTGFFRKQKPLQGQDDYPWERLGLERKMERRIDEHGFDEKEEQHRD
ncbi:hypothetical protein GCM10009304_17660 [Pseudomonas matsuisoli]|uniref:Uncharacterized protein n=1 Tax=Pseudomonas matsuisoli TaxID=1515666 RepID=A0A917PUK4_9PSED|nr:hypothetical protein GCM10009304_17660 [Pseudomonas matsuisoli]